jgi:hypothetical protein
MKKIIIQLCLPIVLMATACNNSGSTEKKADSQIQPAGDSTKNAVYQCPMDCEKGKTYEQPGKCPVCEMDLEKK